jgi:hypothetical protein
MKLSLRLETSFICGLCGGISYPKTNGIYSIDALPQGSKHKLLQDIK